MLFAGRRRRGWVVAVADTSETPERVREISAVDGDRTWFDEDDLRLYRWVATRFAGTLADVLRHAMPQRVAAVEREPAFGEPGRSDADPPPKGRNAASESSQPPRAGGQAPCASTAWRPYSASALLRATASRSAEQGAFWLRTLPGDDPDVLVADLVGRTMWSGRSVLVLVPDPASTLPDTALGVAGAAGVDLRTDIERHRYRAFLRGRAGSATVAVGERGAAFTPLRDLGLVVVHDEANPAYKERRSPRHHAREVALARARMAGATCVLLGDLPSANLWRLLRDGHVTTVAAGRADERRAAPRIDVADTSDPRPTARRTRFGDLANRALKESVRADGAAVVLASRGGQGAALVCRSCRMRLRCPVCTGSLSVAKDDGWRCPACSWAGAPFACPECGDERFAPLAAGAGRLAAELTRGHPTAEVVRMEGFDAPGPTRRPGVGVMTRGSVVTRPAWLRDQAADVVVVPDADAMLLRPGYDAAEDALRLWMAAARWAPRTVVQTREPANHAVQALVRWDPEGFWEREVEQRDDLGFPPAASLIRLTAPDMAVANDVAATLRTVLAPRDVLGPDPSRAILIKTRDLRATLAALRPLREDWGKGDRKIRVDVDPVL